MADKPNPLETWKALNKKLENATEKECWDLLKKEKDGKNRPQFKLRIFGRANKMRTERERKEILR